MISYDRFAVAARLRGLLAGQDAGVVGATANRLGVDEVSLRMSVDDLDPRPSFEVLLAVVREYAVDPTWLISGEYDLSRHRQALDDDAAIARMLTEAVVARPRRPDVPQLPATTRPPASDVGPRDDGQPPIGVEERVETRTRVIVGDDIQWSVREEPWPTVDRRGGHCLIFDGVTVVRRVRSFPPDWFDWPATDLYSLSLTV